MSAIVLGFRTFLGLGLLLATNPGAAWSQTQARAFFDDTVVQEVRLTLDPRDLASLQERYLENTYFRAEFSWNGITKSVGIRSRGSGSRSPIKPNLTVNFSRYIQGQDFLGLDRVSLKANNQDASVLREWLSMKLFRRMGLPAPREAPARLYINDNYQGLYTIVEMLNEGFLQRNFGEKGGYLYSWNAAGTYNFNDLGTDPASYQSFLELETSQSAPDLLNFVSFVQAINRPIDAGYSEADYIRDLSQYINPKLFLTYAAVETVIDDADGILNGIFGINNVYLYQFEGRSLYQMIAWDKDLTLGYAGRDIVDGVTQGENINVLAQRLIAIPEYRNAYLGALDKAADLLGGSGGWADEQIARQYALIRESATTDPNKQCSSDGALFSCGAAEFEQSVEAVRSFLAERAGVVTSQVAAAGHVAPANDPRIGGISLPGPEGSRIAAGAMATITGANFGEFAESPGLPLNSVLSDTFVAVEGVRAPLFSVSPERIELQIPWDIPEGLAAIVVSVDGVMSNTVDVPSLPAAPVILGVLHSDGWPVSPASPVSPGETLAIYATGLGAVNAKLNAGAPGPKEPAAATILTPEVRLGDIVLPVTFSGLAPGYVGLYQINAIAPELVSGQDASLSISAGGQTASAEIAVP
jgi:uncharacterized protein (TIGR03437 family)